MKTVTAHALAILFLMASGHALAYSCTGPVDGIQVNNDGIVSAKSVAGLGWVYFCNVSTQANGVPVDACKAVYATLLTAQLTNRKVQLWFNDASNICDNTGHPAWQWLQGWYWGPSVEGPVP